MAELRTSKSFSCTTDGWSSITSKPYLSSTIHFITPSWKLRTFCLKTLYMPESHTGENVALMIHNILTEYNIQLSSLTSFTTDNGANMKVAIRHLEVTRIPCFGHILHNAINTSVKAVEKVQEMIKQCKVIVSTLNQSFR